MSEDNQKYSLSRRREQPKSALDPMVDLLDNEYFRNHTVNFDKLSISFDKMFFEWMYGVNGIIPEDLQGERTALNTAFKSFDDLNNTTMDVYNVYNELIKYNLRHDSGLDEAKGKLAAEAFSLTYFTNLQNWNTNIPLWKHHIEELTLVHLPFAPVMYNVLPRNMNGFVSTSATKFIRCYGEFIENIEKAFRFGMDYDVCMVKHVYMEPTEWDKSLRAKFMI